MTQTAERRVDVYSLGLCCASACASAGMTREEVEASVNAQHPTGIGSPWRISTDETFASGEPMPSPCERGGGQHWLLNC